MAINRLGTDHNGAARKPHPAEAPTSTPVRVAYVGRYDRHKGIREIVQAIRRLPQTTSIAVDVHGPANSAAEHSLAAELRDLAQPDPRIRFAPAIEPARVPEALASYDLLCCPSTGFENGPTVALDAYAVGTPVIGTRVGNLPELIVDGVNGRLLPPGDVDALARAFQEVADCPRQTVDRWRTNLPPIRTLDHVAADYLAWYTS